MELPFHLRTLEPLPGALDILRYIGHADNLSADKDELCDALGLSERGFSKAIRRLVTKGYLQMDGDMAYRLTEQGQRAVEELAAYDAATGQETVTADDTVTETQRRMIIALPSTLVADSPVRIALGFHEAQGDAAFDESPADVVIRLSVVNGQPASEDMIFQLGELPTQQTLEITPDYYSQVRLRMEAFQLGSNPGDIFVAGGMYIDVPVTNAPEGQQPTVAYGTDIRIRL
jgi:DNA-binding MarR family transcriptional regulator